MRIVFVISGLGAGGAENMLLKLASGLTASHRVTVVSVTGRDDLAERFERSGADVVALGVAGVGSIPGAVWRLARLLRRWQPDVVSTWMYHADLIGGLAARLAGVRAVAWNIRNSNLSPGHSSPVTRALVRVNARLSRALPRAVLCCSQAAKDIHVGIGYAADRFVLVPNGFDLERYRPDPDARRDLRAELRLADAVPIVGLVARWNPQKNHSGFLEAAALLRQRMPGVHFVLAGSDVVGGNVELVRQIAAHGLSDAVHLLGLRDDVPRITAAFDVATSASIYGEAFPNVLGEAMACAVPCVTTDVGDSAAIVGDTGRVVAPGDAAALAAAWHGILSMPAAQRLDLGAAARARVLAHYEIGQVRRTYESLFADLATGASARSAAFAARAPRPRP